MVSVFEQAPRINPADIADWTKVATAVNHSLSMEGCKAAYTCGLMRNFIEAAGCCLQGGFGGQALFLAADTAELLGRCIAGERAETQKDGDRLKLGLKRVAARQDEISRLLVGRILIGHGLGYIRPTKRVNLRMDDGLTKHLLVGLADQLDKFWREPEFGEAEILPLWHDSKPLFVEDMLRRETQGQRVDRPLLYEGSWRS